MRWHRLAHVLLAGSTWIAAGCASAPADTSPLRAQLLAALGDARVFDLRLYARRAHAECRAPAMRTALLPSAMCDKALDAPTLARLATLAGTARNALASDTTADALWTLALVDLVAAGGDAGTLDRVVGRLLEVRARDTTSIAVLNDLAVAHAVRATVTDDPRDQFVALEYIEQAWARDSTNAASRFNRAVLLERMRLLALAGEAWDGVAAAETGGWHAEATARAAQLRDAERSMAAAARTITAGSIPDSATIALSPQVARTWALDTLVPRWASAFRRGDSVDAGRTLTTIRSFGQGLFVFRGDSTVLLVAEEIQRASSRPASANLLAQSIAEAASGVSAFVRTEYAIAESQLRRAQDGYAALDVPVLSAWHRMQLAGVALYASDYATADRLFTGIIALGRQRGAIAIEGRGAWGLGLSQERHGMRAEALENIARAVRAFAGLGEVANRGFLERMLGESLIRVGRHRDGARAEYSALEALQLSGEHARRHVVLLTTAQEAAAIGQRAVARIFALEAVRMAPRTGVPKDVAESLVRLGWVQAERGEVGAATATLAAAREAMAPITDSLIRSRIMAEYQRAESAVLTRRDPARALERVDAVLAYFEGAGIVTDIVRTHVQRADLRLSLRDSTGAMADLDRANRLVTAEITRGSDKGQIRELVRSRSEVYRRLVLLALARGDTARARSSFRMAAADTLLPGRAVRRGQGASLDVSYLVLADRVIVWCESVGRSRFVAVPIARERLGSLVARYVNLIRQDGDSASIAVVGGELRALLLDPIAGDLRAGQQLRLFPDREVAAVPFAALPLSDGQPLITQRGVAYADRAGTTSVGRIGPVATAGAVFVGDPAFDRTLFADLPRLRGADSEIDSLLPLYARPIRLGGTGATRASLLTVLPTASLLHFAGHSRVIPDDPATAHLVLSGTGSDFASSVLYAEDIAALRLPALRTVVLSSCGQTRMAGQLQQENGLVRAFLDAGAAVVVASQWEADDGASAGLMRDFHRRLRAGDSAAEAMRAAQLGALRAGSGRGPVPLRVWATYRVHERSAGE